MSILTLQKFHVRNVFKLLLPLQSNELPNVSLSTTTSNFGITLTYPSTSVSYHYRINLYSNFRVGQTPNKREEAFTTLLEWAKKNPTTFRASSSNGDIEAMEMHLRVGPGFDFRKVPTRYVRFEIECFESGSLQCKASSKLCQLLGKRRTASASDVDQVTIPLFWQDNSNQPNFDMEIEELLGAFSKEESPSSSLQIDNNHISETSPSDHEHVLEMFDSSAEVGESPEGHERQDILAMGYDNNSNSAVSNYGSDSPVYDMIVPRLHNEQYMVLYNGNAEVVGNFRALNFYKASDINIKEDIRLLNEDRDPRNVILKIDGVEYKFKDNVQHSTNKRFVGYIAQQIESVVPEAVQLIDGILHVDYESLIPYLSESIKQNFSDIQGLKSDTKKLEVLLEKLYEQFTKAETPVKSIHSKSHSSPRHDNRPSWLRSKWAWFAGIVFLVLVGATATAIGLLLTNDHHVTPSATPVPVLSDSATKMALKSFYKTMHGDNWKTKTKWLSDSSVCEWYGVTCQEPFSDEIITAIKLPDNNLEGKLEEQSILANVSSLREVDLSQNHIQSGMSLTLSASITHLNLAETDIAADIRSFNQLTSIKYINLAYTNVFGEFSFSARQLMYLKSLNVSHTLLTSYTPEILKDVQLDVCDWSSIGTLICDGPECVEHDGHMKCDLPQWLTNCGGTCRWSDDK